MEQEIKFSKESAIRTIAELKDKVEELTAAKTIEKIVNRDVVHEVVITNSEMGGDIGKLAEALSLCQGEFKSIGKNTEGHGYVFSSFQDVVEKTSPILSKNGLSITQLTITKMHGNLLLAGVRTILMHTNGGYVSGESYCPTMKTKMNSTVQMFGVNTSYEKRYGWLAICGVATTDQDTDGVG